jgi:hypothetical protein
MLELDAPLGSGKSSAGKKERPPAKRSKEDS